jgi:hypothetical protein
MTPKASETNGTAIDTVARQLRAALGPVLRAAAGGEPATMKLVRAIAIDKSLASVLVRAVNAPSDRELLQLVPSPTGLRILLERTKGVTSPTAAARLRSATESFRRLLDATPGGRAALDARLAGQAPATGSKRENTSRQATFKSLSFLLGYYGEIQTSTILLVPSEDGKVVDGIEIYRRLGVRRMKPGATIPLFSFEPWPDDDQVGVGRLDPITPDPQGPQPSNLLLPEYCTDPLPRVTVAREGANTTVILPGTDDDESAMDFAWAFRLRNGGPRDPGSGVKVLHGYFLHMPTRRVVRDVYIAEDVYPGATPFISWALPRSHHYEHPPGEGADRYYAQVDLEAEFEPMVGAKRTFGVSGLSDHDRLIRGVLARSGHAQTKFRGFRCSLNYPVPLLDMYVWLRHS